MLTTQNYQNFYCERPNVCVFSNIGVPCDKRMAFGCFCMNHMRAIFRMTVVQDTVCTRFTTKRLTKQVLTQPVDVVFPFPFTLNPNDGSFCLNDVLANQMISQYVSQLQVRDDAQGNVKKSISAILLSLICNGALMSGSCGANVGYFQQYMMSASNFYRKRMQQTTLQLLNYNGGSASFLTMSELPFIYLVIFQFMEMSTLMSTASNGMLTMSAKVALDMSKQAFILINESEDTPIFFDKDGSTYSTPLILAGIKRSAHILPFSAEEITFNPFQALPTMCNARNKLTITQGPNLPPVDGTAAANNGTLQLQSSSSGGNNAQQQPITLPSNTESNA